KIEEFEVEIIGVLRNFAPNKNLILGRIKGPFFEKTGVIAGMSGSPIYVNDKIIGAIAYHFPFSKEAVAGITPIEEMIEISKKKTSKTLPSLGYLPVQDMITAGNFKKILNNLFLKKAKTFYSNSIVTPAIIPLVFSGFSPQVVEKHRNLFKNLGLEPIMGGSVQRKPSIRRFSLEDIKLREGEPVAIQLITGDLEVSGVGTVTYVDGSRVLAFGHPFFNLGTVEYLMSKAEVLTVVPSLESSFKLANTGDIVGKFTQDRFSGLLGEIGKMPYLVPLNIEIKNAGKSSKSFHLKFINDKILTPTFIYIALQNLVVDVGRSIGNLSLAFNGDIYLDNGKSVHLEDLFSGSLDSSAEEFSNLIAAVVYYLVNNQFKEVKIHKIDIKASCEEDLNVGYLEKVFIDKFEARPGDILSIKIYTRTSKGKLVENRVNLQVPYLPPGTEFNILIGDSRSIFQIESAQYRKRYFMPRSLDQLIRLLNNLRKNNRIYFKLFTSKKGIFLNGEEMPNLPPLIQRMLLSPRASSSPSITSFSTIKEYQLPVPFVFNGSTIIPIKVKE
ncbi:hypothetical protein NLB65_01160, partial [Candidatus Aminicenantes bacterium AC-335-B20]|nr:hypothetical protein [Candidatus Aminicenantes bacterium AC-335-B20]